MSKLSNNFDAFFKRINPSSSYINIAARAHSEIVSLIENKDGPAGDLKIRCFLQGSYKRQTAIHTINDVDIVALCKLSYSSNANQNTRDQMFQFIADSISKNNRYSDKIKFNKNSMCIKVLLSGIKIEVLPALREENMMFEHEPIYIFQPNINENEEGFWRKTYARKHQQLCTQKNSSSNSFFVPMIKVIKHLRSVRTELSDSDAFSFHIECLLYALRNSIYNKVAYCDCIESVLKALDGFSPEKATSSGLKSPCGDKEIFSNSEWSFDSYLNFHNAVKNWKKIAIYANRQTDKNKAIDAWKELLGETYFPKEPS